MPTDSIKSNKPGAGIAGIITAAGQKSKQKSDARIQAASTGGQAAMQQQNIQAQRGMQTEKIAADRENRDAILEDNQRGRRETMAHDKTLQGIENSLRIKLQASSEDHAELMSKNLTSEMEKNRRIALKQWGMSALLDLWNASEMRALIVNFAGQMGAKQTVIQKMIDDQTAKRKESVASHAYVTETKGVLNHGILGNPKLKIDSPYYEAGGESTKDTPMMIGPGGFPSRRIEFEEEDRSDAYLKNWDTWAEDSLQEGLLNVVPDSDDRAGPPMVSMDLLDDPKATILAGMIDGKAVDAYDLMNMIAVNDAQMEYADQFKKKDGTFDNPAHQKVSDKAHQRHASIMAIYYHKTAGPTVRHAMQRVKGVTLADNTADIQNANNWTAEETMENLTKVQSLTDRSQQSQVVMGQLNAYDPLLGPEVQMWYDAVNLKGKSLHDGAGASADFDTSLGPLGPVPKEPSLGKKYY